MGVLFFYLPLKTCQVTELGFWPRSFKDEVRQLCGLGVLKIQTALLKCTLHAVSSGVTAVCSFPHAREKLATQHP